MLPDTGTEVWTLQFLCYAKANKEVLLLDPFIQKLLFGDK